MRLWPIVFLYKEGTALHAAKNPRTPTDREREKKKLYQTSCGRPTDHLWQRPAKEVATLLIKNEVLPVCAVCFPHGLDDT